MSRLFEDLLFCINEQEESEEKETSLKRDKAKQTEEKPVEKETTKDVEIATEEPIGEEGTVVDPEEQLTVVDQVYRLKKIYSKLIAISGILDYHTDSKFDDIRDKMVEAIDLFHIIVSNFDSFKDNIDNIIKSFYKLLQSAIEELDRLSRTKE